MREDHGHRSVRGERHGEPVGARRQRASRDHDIMLEGDQRVLVCAGAPRRGLGRSKPEVVESVGHQASPYLAVEDAWTVIEDRDLGDPDGLRDAGRRADLGQRQRLGQEHRRAGEEERKRGEEEGLFHGATLDAGGEKCTQIGRDEPVLCDETTRFRAEVRKSANEPRFRGRENLGFTSGLPGVSSPLALNPSPRGPAASLLGHGSPGEQPQRRRIRAGFRRGGRDG